MRQNSVEFELPVSGEHAVHRFLVSVIIFLNILLFMIFAFFIFSALEKILVSVKIPYFCHQYTSFRNRSCQRFLKI